MAEPKTPEEFQAWLEYQAELLDKGVISQQEYNNAKKDAAVGMRGYAATLKASQEQLKKSFADLGSSVLKGEEGAGVYNNTINATTKTISSFLSRIPYVGKLIGTLVEAGGKYAAAVNDQADVLFKNYKELSRNGLATGMKDTFENLQDMGYTAAEIGNMSSLLKENSGLMSNLGGTAASGAKQFAKIAKDIQYNDIGNQFRLLGMNVDDINKGIAGYTRIQRASGTLHKQTAEEIADSAAEYMMNQDRLTKLTGLSADQQNNIIEEAMAEESFAATQAALRRNGDKASLDKAKFNEEMIKRLRAEAGPKVAAQYQKFASGMLNSEGAQQFYRVFGTAASSINDGLVNSDEAIKLMRSDAQVAAVNLTTLAKAGKSEPLVGSMPELLKIAGEDLNENKKNAEGIAAADRKRQLDATDAGVKNMVALTTAQRNQTMVTDKLTNVGIVPVTKGMATLAEGLENASDIVGKLAGRTDRLGGGQTTVSAVADKVKSFFGKSKPASTTTTPSAAPASPGGTAEASEQAIAAASPQLKKIIGAESGGRNIPNQSGENGQADSSAFGVAQMIQPTFEGLAAKAKQGSALYGKTFEDMKADVNLQVSAAEQLLLDNKRSLARAGITTTDGNLYLAHFLGAKGAIKVIEARASEDIAKVTSEAAREKNKNIFASVKTAGELRDLANRKMSGQPDIKTANKTKPKAETVAKTTEAVTKPETPELLNRDDVKITTDAVDVAAAKITTAVQTKIRNKTEENTVKNEPVAPKQSAATGGILTGPKSGYEAQLHGTEAVVPLPDGRSIPVQMNNTSTDSYEQVKLLTQELDKLESLVYIMQRQNDISNKILQRQS